MRLSKNFTLGEFLVSQTAARRGIDMTPPDAVMENIQNLVTGTLQPVRDLVKHAIFISSGYRPLELNTAIGGSSTSAHLLGNAADFMVAGLSPYHTCVAIRASDILYDQLIHEHGFWVHLGVSIQMRGEELTAYRDEGHTEYLAGIIKMEDTLHRRST